MTNQFDELKEKSIHFIIGGRRQGKIYAMYNSLDKDKLIRLHMLKDAFAKEQNSTIEKQKQDIKNLKKHIRTLAHSHYGTTKIDYIIIDEFSKGISEWR